MSDVILLSRIYRLKLVITGILLVVLGLAVSAASEWLTASAAPHLAVALSNSLADLLLVTGAIGVAVDFFTNRDREAADT